MSIKTHFKNLRISQKFVISLCLFLIIPLTLLLIVVNYNVRSNLNAKVCDVNLENLKQTKIGIENFINDVEFISLNIATNDEMQSLIKKVNQKEEKEFIQRQHVKASFQVRSLLETRNNIRSVSIFNEEDIIYQFGDYVLEEDLQFLEMVKEKQGKTFWTGVHEGKTTSYGASYHKLYLMRAVNDLYSMDRLAYERLTIDESVLRSLYKGVAEKESAIFIVDLDGKILSSTKGERIGEQFEKSLMKDMPLGSAAYKNIGKEVITYYSLEEIGWRVIKIDDAKSLFENNNVVYKIILLCIAFTIIFGIIFTIIQRKTMITPIVKLSKQTELFQADHFTIQTYSDSNDEIGDLNRNLGQMVIYIQNLIETQYKNEIKKREIELKYMQSQINPHFLYNTLDSIRWMAVTEQKNEMVEQIEALSDIFRHALNSGKEIVTIEQEVEHLNSYILIQKNRFGKRIQVDIQVEEELKTCKVLKLILQPLVENAIVHGLEDKVEGGTVKVQICSDGDVVCYIVEDDGLGTDEARINQYLVELEQNHNVFALKNIEERIKIKYGNEYGLEFHSIIGVGTKVVVRIPNIK